jgi:hypothetical protein
MRLKKFCYEFEAARLLTGTVVEMILVAHGLYSFVHPDILGVPYWLPGIYTVAALAVGDLGRALFRFSKQSETLQFHS